MYGSRKPVESSVLHALSATNACFTRHESSSKLLFGVGHGQ